MMDVKKYGPWVCVTGASDGIGRACAKELAQVGFNCVLVARSSEKLNALAAELKSKHAIEVRVVDIDLTDATASQKLQSEIDDLDIGLYVLAAGFGSAGLFLSNPISSEVNMLKLNCQVVLEQCYIFGNKLSAKKRGGIVLFSSLLGFQGTPYSSNYAATKAYIQSFGEGLAVELKQHSVDVLIVAPGPIRTGFGARANMNMSMALTPDLVAKQTLQAMGKRTTIRPGWLSKLLGWSLAMAPRWIAVIIIGKIMRGMASQ